MKIIGKRASAPVRRHTYSAQLIRPDETIALERKAETFSDAIDRAREIGARARMKGETMPKIEGARAIYPCRDKRFARVQIIIEP